MGDINNLKKLEMISIESKQMEIELEKLSKKLDTFKNNIEVVEEVSERMASVFKLYKEFIEVLNSENM
ncbi:hypothetical protein NBO_80g0032 [Nosema bombycis CQ1]|uniref:Uncharacterized protein n=1 Tax=Nosema bombycis (strain CQ1 / CVCC 102059) TaxID=578461 RepID=R0M5Y1_NOSB1|nr:hypothetical protein NBO_80g0032 [Nosema bombycis CQ1]|eukprot:EOB13369.1 hypothetical protein NBO_80g0032 [Nosema bombycis CQ1]